MERPHPVIVLLQATVERSALDTFDLWTRYEALPRLRRRSLLGDTSALRRISGTRPRITPSATTAVEGADGYAATVWIRALTDSSSAVFLAVDDPHHAEHAARDLARFVEFALVDSMEVALAGWDVCECLGGTPERLSDVTAGYRRAMNDASNTPDTAATDTAATDDSVTDEHVRRATADRMPTADEERAAERGAAQVDLGEVAAHYEEMAETGANVRGEGQIEPDR